MRQPEQISKRGVFRGLWEAWKRVGRRVADLQGRLLLTIFYFIVVAPFALVIRWWSDPLAIKAAARRGWRPRGDEQGTPLERAKTQF